MLRPSGSAAIAVWDSVENVEGYAPLADLMDRLYGQETGDAMRSPFVLGDRELIRKLFADAGAHNIDVTRQVGTMRFPSLRAWLTTEIRGWILADRLDDAQFEQLVSEVEPIIAPYLQADGSVALRAPAFIITAAKE